MDELLKWWHSIDPAIVEMLATILGGLLALGSGFFFRALERKEPPEVESYSERLANLMKSLTKASSEVDNILAELAQVAGDRHNTVLELEAQLTELEEHERQLQQRIQDLEKVPIPVAEHFAKMIAPGERRSAWRDYGLFAAGVVVSTVIAILLRLAGLG
jgi:predicted negative regulator of RcsB-dependent stress response